MNVYYNDNEPFVCAWLRNLIAAKLIPPGDVDERSITEVQPGDLRGYDQVHFFAGIGGWTYALRLAGWEEPVWTGSCPCQPFSSAGKAGGVLDERHLWPSFRRLIAECRPATVFGEQVASKAGREWLSGVRLDLEALGYAVGAADLCAASIGAPHIRQRLYWVADSVGRGTRTISAQRIRNREPDTYRSRQRMGDATYTESTRQPVQQEQLSGPTDRVGDAESERACGGEESWGRRSGVARASTRHSAWEPSEIVNGRRIKPGVRLLVDGFPNRVGTLRGFGNAIVPQVAAEFVSAFMKCQP